MATEIERKFIIDPTRLPEKGEADIIQQGYLSETSPIVRVRHVILGGLPVMKTVGFITIKGEGLISRPEYEYEIPPEDAAQILHMSKFSLFKARYYVPVGDHTWEVDKFTGSLSGFWLAEIELKSEDEVFLMPTWVVKEVSRDKRFSNFNLARDGWPTRW